MPELNYNAKLEEVRNLITSWSKRHLSPLGKITVTKSIILPKLTHLFIALPTLDLSGQEQSERLLFKFIWKQNDRIARGILIRDYS